MVRLNEKGTRSSNCMRRTGRRGARLTKAATQDDSFGTSILEQFERIVWIGLLWLKQLGSIHDPRDWRNAALSFQTWRFTEELVRTAMVPLERWKREIAGVSEEGTDVSIETIRSKRIDRIASIENVLIRHLTKCRAARSKRASESHRFPRLSAIVL